MLNNNTHETWRNGLRAHSVLPSETQKRQFRHNRLMVSDTFSASSVLRVLSPQILVFKAKRIELVYQRSFVVSWTAVLRVRALIFLRRFRWRCSGGTRFCGVWSWMIFTTNFFVKKTAIYRQGSKIKSLKKSYTIDNLKYVLLAERFPLFLFSRMVSPLFSGRTRSWTTEPIIERNFILSIITFPFPVSWGSNNGIKLRPTCGEIPMRVNLFGGKELGLKMNKYRSNTLVCLTKIQVFVACEKKNCSQQKKIALIPLNKRGLDRNFGDAVIFTLGNLLPNLVQLLAMEPVKKGLSSCPAVLGGLGQAISKDEKSLFGFWIQVQFLMSFFWKHIVYVWTTMTQN